MSKAIKAILIFVGILIAILVLGDALSEEEPFQVIVTASQLNGRADPRKSASIEAVFDKDDILDATGKWSSDCTWIEVKGGETGTVWVKITYVSENIGSFYMANESFPSVKIRKKPFKGKVIGYLEEGEVIQVNQVVGIWGKTSKGWIDLTYLTEAN